MNRVFLGLGSNLGNREEMLERALQAIKRLEGTCIVKVSSVLETKAEGFDGNDFLNLCCEIRTELQPRALLSALKGIEREMGRECTGPKFDENGRRIYSNRPIDIDILVYSDLTISEEDLQIPHPRMLERYFVMIPLNEIRNN